MNTYTGEVLMVLNELADQLRAGGASLPAPENKGTPDSAILAGLSIALCLVEMAIAKATGSQP